MAVTMTRLVPRAVAHRLARVVRAPATRIIAATVVVLVGAGMVFLAAAVGHCAAFGGLCPAPRVPWWQDDVFGTAAVGLVFVVAGPVLARRPSRRGLLLASVGTLATLPVAWLLAEAARTGSW